MSKNQLFSSAALSSSSNELVYGPLSIPAYDFNLIVLRYSMAKSPNQQINMSLSNNVYVLNFGERLYPANLVCAVPSFVSCQGGDLKKTVNLIYKKHKLGQTPLEFTFNGEAFQGYVANVNIEASSDQEAMHQVTFQLLTYQPIS